MFFIVPNAPFWSGVWLIFMYPGSMNKVDHRVHTDRDGILQLLVNFVVISRFFFCSILYEKLKLVVIIYNILAEVSCDLYMYITNPELI